MNLSPQIAELGKALCALFVFNEDIKEKLLKGFSSSSLEASDPQGSNATQELISNLVEFQPGVSFLAVIGVLGTFFNNLSIASVFSELALSAKARQDLLPSPADWKSLIHTLNVQLISSREFESLLNNYFEERDVYSQKILPHKQDSSPFLSKINNQPPHSSRNTA